ncbi:hypothetical protein AB0G73_19820 [Streptomyces sp. NPDC020719]|uniref:hypothetical protein n=1 Tax=Streptomyces sp. NPDC020719 TaxID=3154896 RepID=UPI0033EDB67C
MAWEEWEQLKADAAARQYDGLRLDSASGAGGASDLKTDYTAKDLAAKTLREDLRPGTDKAGGFAEEPSGATAREFSAWETGSGLKDAHAEWERQVKGLQARLARDQAALEQTKREFQHTDHGVEGQMAQLAAQRDRQRER